MTKRKPKDGDQHPGGGVWCLKPTQASVRRAIMGMLKKGAPLHCVKRSKVSPTFWYAWIGPLGEDEVVCFERMGQRLTAEG